MQKNVQATLRLAETNNSQLTRPAVFSGVSVGSFPEQRLVIEPMSIGEQADFFVDQSQAENWVDRFKYLGSYVTKDCKLDEEITARIQAASCVMGRLRDRAFDCRDLTVETKLKVHN